MGNASIIYLACLSGKIKKFLPRNLDWIFFWEIHQLKTEKSTKSFISIFFSNLGRKNVAIEVTFKTYALQEKGTPLRHSVSNSDY